MCPPETDDRDSHATDGETPRGVGSEGEGSQGTAHTHRGDDEAASRPDQRKGHAQRRIEDMVLRQLFDLQPTEHSIGRYRVLDQIGQGGMGTVFSAYDDQLDRKVAIKVLETTGDSGSSASLRLKREALALARLSHPNVVTVHEVGETEHEVYVVMEFLRGQSLDSWIEERPHWREVLGVFIQAGRGIVAAHEAGLVHRDLKPHNIMRTEDGTVKVLDFGLARADDMDDPDEATEYESRESLLTDPLTRTGAVLGTPAYMAPEQHRGRPTDARTDQFGFCATLYQVLYGRLPFAASTLPELVDKILDDQVTPPPEGTRVPAWVHRIVVRGLRADPAERWPSMQALLQAMERDPARARRRWATVTGLGLLAALGGYSLSRLQTATEQACPAIEDEVEALWSSERRARVADAFAATGNLLATDTLARTSASIDAYVTALGRMRAEACEAHREGHESTRLFDLRTACLDVRRSGFEQLAQQFERASASTVDNAAWAVASLPLVDPCGDAEALTAAVPPPEQPLVARQVQQQREALASARAMGLTGSHEQATTLARAVLQQAEAIGYLPLVAEAELRLGDILREQNEHEPAHEALSRGVRSALRSVHYEAAVEALALRMWIVAEPLGRPGDALADDAIAEPMLEKLGRPARLQWLLLNNRAVAQFRSGAPVEAERSYRDALGAALSLGEHALPVEVISTRANLAMLQSEGLGRPDVAARELRSARSRAIELLGPEHPRVFMLTSLLAEYLASAGRSTEALAEFEAARRDRSPDAYNRIKLRVELAWLHHRLRRYAAALEAADEALALTLDTMPDDYLGSVALWHRGSARIGLGEVDEGIRDLMQAVEREAARDEIPGDRLAAARVWAGLGLRQAGRLDEAIAQLEQALEITVGLGPAAYPALGRRFLDLVDAYLERDSLLSAEALVDRIADAQDAAGFDPESRYRLLLAKRRGDLLVAQGRRSAAHAAYERACQGQAAQVEANDPDLADCRLSLAEALGQGQRARTLATRAAEAYRQLGEAFAPERRRAQRVATGLADETAG